MHRPLTLIHGVHRSGTSLLAHGLRALGAQAGDFSDRRDPDNPDGYGEHPVVRQFNDRLLARLGASWDNWGFRAGLVDWDAGDLASWQDEAVAILQAAFPGPGSFVLKDPRCTMLAPFWERVVPQAGFALQRILVIRDPLEVAESQRQRVARRPHQFTVIAEVEPMAALWAVTMTECLQAFSDDSTLLIGHADQLAAPVATLTAAAAFAQLTPDGDAIARFAASGVKSELYRSHPPASAPGTVEGAWTEAARALFSDLNEAGLPRVLPRAEARAIAAAQARVTAMHPGLPAVQASLARKEAVEMQAETRIQALNHLIHALSPLAVRAGGPALSKAIDRATELAESSEIAVSSFAFSLAVGRLFLFAGRRSEGLDWLDKLRPRFGHIASFVQLERKLFDLPAAPRSRPSFPRFWRS